jgi:hypothetical protein
MCLQLTANKHALHVQFVRQTYMTLNIHQTALATTAHVLPQPMVMEVLP